MITNQKYNPYKLLSLLTSEYGLNCHNLSKVSINSYIIDMVNQSNLVFVKKKIAFHALYNYQNYNHGVKDY